MGDRAEVYLVKRKSVSKGEHAERWQLLETLYSRKLWHQLTVEMRSAMHDEGFKKQENLKDVYDNFIHDFEHRINPLQLVEIILPVARQIFDKDRDAAYLFLKAIEKTVSKDKEAVVRCWTAVIELKLNHKDSAGRCQDIQAVRKLIEDTQTALDELVGVTVVHAAFYKVSSIYLREIGDYAAYYREALRYLGCEQASILTTADRKMHAVLLGFAALLGQNVYNFGELLAHPILKALEGTPEQWLIDVLYAFNAGDLDKFYEFKKHWGEWDDIKKHQDFLENKIRLLCLMEIALGRPSKERHIPFDEIARRAQVKDDQVELLVMRALSRGLVRGSIDQVNKTVSISWVQPRVLDNKQISAMADRIGAWCRDVEHMEAVVKENAKEILTKS